MQADNQHPHSVSHKHINRRAFMLSSLATSAGLAADLAKPLTLTRWLKASSEARRQALQTCLGRIKEQEPAIHAWVQVLPQPPLGGGKLSGIPFGVKDIFETRGLATEYGSPIYKGRTGTFDATIVRRLRERGAILLGKTQTTAFSYRTPAPTRNPRDLEHTPGGSSSGSAAAVAAGMVPFAVGEQTIGSTLRPASYCGVTGFKPTFDLVPTSGMLAFAKSMDTVGFFTDTPNDMLALWDAIGYSSRSAEDFPLGVCDPLPEVEPSMLAAFQETLSRLRGAGLVLRSVDIAAMLASLAEANQTVLFYEGARFHEARYRQYGDQLGVLADLVRDGLRMPIKQYQDATRYIAGCRTQMTEIYRLTPVILVPAATGPAPLGLTFTGDWRMNSPWTALGTPAISMPMPVGASLPLGLQLTADRGEDARVLKMAARIQRVLDEK
jgi:Asp-tRNA(Asn)/Glu-tRNA(Gln) amidotransferase A subunit family amidase